MVAVGLLLVLVFVLSSAQDVVVDKEVNEAVASDPSTGRIPVVFELTQYRSRDCSFELRLS